MAAPAAYSRRSYVGNAAATTVPLGMGAADGSCTLASGTNWPSGSGGNFLVVIDRGLNTEEKAWCSGTSGTTLTFSQRGAEGTSAQSHSTGCTIALCIGSMDADEANQVVSAVLGQSGAAKGDILYMLSAAGPNTLQRLGIGSTGSILQATSGGVPAWLASGTVGQALLTNSGGTIGWGAVTTTAAGIEGTFTAANQIYLGTGSGTGTQASLTSGYGVTGFVANPPAPAVSLTSVESYISVSVTGIVNSPTNITSATLGAGTWLITARVLAVASATTIFDLWIGPTSASTTSAYAGTSTQLGQASGTEQYAPMSISKVVVLGSQTTVYLIGFGSSASNSVSAAAASQAGEAIPNCSGISAVRIA